MKIIFTVLGVYLLMIVGFIYTYPLEQALRLLMYIHVCLGSVIISFATLRVYNALVGNTKILFQTQNKIDKNISELKEISRNITTSSNLNAQQTKTLAEVSRMMELAAQVISDSLKKLINSTK